MDVPSDIPPKDLHSLMMSYYSAKIKVTEATATRLSIDTVDQGESVVLYEERRKRLTASNVGKIAKRKATTKVGPTVQQLLHTKFHGNVATSWGNFQEEDSNREYLRVKKQSSPNITTSKSGLVASVANLWLGASPDRMVYDPTSNPPDGLKSPYTARNMTIDEAVCNIKTFVLVEINLPNKFS